MLISIINNQMVREELGPRGICGRVHGVGLVHCVTRSGLVCDTPSARSADACEARFLVEFSLSYTFVLFVQTKPIVLYRILTEFRHG